MKLQKLDKARYKDLTYAAESFPQLFPATSFTSNP